MPTVDEFEYVSEGGNGYLYGTSDGTLSHTNANYSGESSTDAWVGTSPVASFPANLFGVHDLCGNVGEWCWNFSSAGRGGDNRLDYRNGAYAGWANRSIMGGSAIDDETSGRLTNEIITGHNPSYVAGNRIGFRCARSIP